MPQPDPTADAVRSEFIQRMGVHGQHEGLPPGAGRVFALLLLEGGPIAFGKIADRLDMSRASVSGAVRVLEERGLVRRGRKPGCRQDYFETVPDPFPTMLDAARQRCEAVRADVDAAIAALPDGDEAAGRLAALSQFYRAMAEGLGTTLDRLRDTE